jgi:hypothetical protein
MATRALVGMTKDGETVEYIYSHLDGYPEGLGETLSQSYTTTEQVKALLDLGDASYIKARLNQSCFYGRDRGEVGDYLAAKTIPREAWGETIGAHGADYGYLFDARTERWATFDADLF